MERSEAYRAAYLALNKEIKAHKRACFENLCLAANSTPRGDAYRVVMVKASAPKERSPEMLQKIVETPLSRHDTRSWAPVPYGQTGQSEAARVTNDELIAIA